MYVYFKILQRKIDMEWIENIKISFYANVLLRLIVKSKEREWETSGRVWVGFGYMHLSQITRFVNVLYYHLRKFKIAKFFLLEINFLPAKIKYSYSIDP